MVKWTEKAEKLLKKYWGITELKEKQFEVINELLLGNDVIGLLPTGYGKSLCYILPPLLTKKTIFIVSPLISLMEDQKEKLVEKKIPCATLHGSNPNRQREIYSVLDGNINIVYMSPEFLINGDGIDIAQQLIDENKMGFLAVDESHCISVWGQDFRPEYTKIKKFREKFPQIPIIALTATATTTVCKDIATFIGMVNPSIIRTSFDRPNIHIAIDEIGTGQFEKSVKIRGKIHKKIVTEKLPKHNVIMDWMNKYKDEKIIVYVNSRSEADDLALQLDKCVPNKSKAYHAGLSRNERDDIQILFSSGKIDVIICTIAFGMGIDQTVRGVIIFGTPSSIEEYYQQIGRAGRDGNPSFSVLYFDYSRLVIAKHQQNDIKLKYPQLYKAKMINLDMIGKFAYTSFCKRRYILEYFGEECNFINCNNCSNCCDKSLIDVTQDFGKIIFSGISLATAEEKIKNEYLSPVGQKLNLYPLLLQWKKILQTLKLAHVKYLPELPSELLLKLKKELILEKPENNYNLDNSLCETDVFDKYDNIIEKITKTTKTPKKQ